MRAPRWSWITMLGLCVVSIRPAEAADVVILRARCVDPLARTIEERSLWITDGRIAAVGAPDGSDLPAATATITRWDLEGGYAVPALADAWVYGGTQRSPGHRDRVGAEGTSRLALGAGVIEFVDVFAEPGLQAWRAQVEGDRARGARPRLGGPPVTAPRGVGSDMPGIRMIRDAASMSALVDSLAALPIPVRPEVLSLIFDGSRREPRLDVEALAAAIERGRTHGMEVAVQVGTWRDVYEALEQGASWIVQLPFGPLPEAVRQQVAARAGLVWTPTLALGLDFVRLCSEVALREDPLLVQALPVELRQDYAAVRLPQNRYAEVAERRTTAFENLRLLLDNGVRLRAGSGSGALGTAHGWSLLREIEWMVQAGVDPFAALASALPGVPDGEAWFTVGARSDLMIVPRSPIDDPTALRALEGLVVDGQRIDPRAVAVAVTRQIEEDLPANPMPFGGRVPLVVVVLAVFAVLYALRHAVKRAVARTESGAS